MRTLLLALLLAGCASGPQMPERVEVPVQVPCIERVPEKPQTTPRDALLALDDYRFVLSLWRDRMLMEDYAAQLEATVEGCK